MSTTTRQIGRYIGFALVSASLVVGGSLGLADLGHAAPAAAPAAPAAPAVPSAKAAAPAAPAPAPVSRGGVYRR